MSKHRLRIDESVRPAARLYLDGFALRGVADYKIERRALSIHKVTLELYVESVEMNAAPEDDKFDDVTSHDGLKVSA